MNYEAFKENNDQVLTEEITRLNAMEEGEERDKLYSEIFEKVDILTFLIPVNEGFISNEDISDFYLEQRPSLDEIISCYKISKVSFMVYFREVLRKRAVIFTLTKYRNDSRRMRESIADLNEFIDDDCYWQQIIENMVYSDDKLDDSLFLEEDEGDNFYETFSFTGDYDNYSLSELSYHIIAESSFREKRHLSEVEVTVRSHLRTYKTRKDFVALLLYVPNEFLYHKSLTLSKMLQVDEEALIKFIEKKDKFQGEEAKRKKKETAKALAIKHHESVLKYSNEIIFSAIDREEKKKKYQSEVRVRNQYLERIRDMNYYSRGLSQEQIAKILFLTRSCISDSVKCAKRNLSSVFSELDRLRNKNILIFR